MRTATSRALYVGLSRGEYVNEVLVQLEPGETILVQAGGSGIGTVAIKMAKAIGCTVITTVGDDEKAAKAKALGADHVINYRTERFETITRKLTNKKGVDVVFEHVGGEGFNGSLLVLKRGGRLVTCGSTAGPSITFNLMQLFRRTDLTQSDLRRNLSGCQRSSIRTKPRSTGPV